MSRAPPGCPSCLSPITNLFAHYNTARGAMFYEPDKGNHGLPHDPYKSIVVPRPIGWISTIDRDGRVNLAPFSQFNNLGYDPPYVMFAAANFPRSPRPKDSVTNVVETGEFVVNMATYELREAVN